MMGDSGAFVGGTEDNEVSEGNENPCTMLKAMKLFLTLTGFRPLNRFKCAA